MVVTAATILLAAAPLFVYRSPDGSCILACSNDCSMRLFNLPTELYTTVGSECVEMVNYSVKIAIRAKINII